MRVLAFDSRAVPGGAERALATLVRSWSATGIEVTVVVGEDGPLVDWLGQAACRVQVGDAEVLRDAVAALKPDVVLSVGARSHLIAGPLAAEQACPAVWWRELTPRGRPAELAAAAVPTAAVVCATGTAAAGQRALTPGTRVVVIPPGLDLDPIAARRREGRRIRRDLGWERGPIVGMVARLDPAKGQDLFLEAASRIVAVVPAARFVVVGGAVVGHEGDWVDVLAEQADRLGLGNRVRFVGHVDDPIPWQAALDIAVSASRHEAFGLSVLESMVLGVPVVATPTDGSRWLLDEGAAGLLLDEVSALGVGDGVLSLLASPGHAADLARRAITRARSFDVSRTATAFADLFASIGSLTPTILSSRRPSAARSR